VLGASGPVVRSGLVSYSVGILMLPAAGALGLAGAVFGAIALFRRAGVARSLFAVVLGASVAAIPIAAYLRARSVPPINDISTDPGEQADAQRSAYPDIRPLRLASRPISRSSGRRARWRKPDGRSCARIRPRDASRRSRRPSGSVQGRRRSADYC
jgi:hypothetical protein